MIVHFIQYFTTLWQKNYHRMIVLYNKPEEYCKNIRNKRIKIAIRSEISKLTIHNTHEKDKGNR